MALATNIFDFLNEIEVRLPPKEHFRARYLETLFRDKIAKSQATGKDGVRIGRFSERIAEEVALIERKVQNQSYSFTTYKERLLFRGSTRYPRQISIPTVRDRLALRSICKVLHTYVPSSVGASPHGLVKKVSNAIKNLEPNHSFVRIDVRDFFPSVTHEGLLAELVRHDVDPLIRDLCMKAVKTPTGSGGEENHRGIPQGLSISGALAAIYMLRFDTLQSRQNPNYFRYVDDVLLITETSSATRELDRIRRALNSRGLSAHKLGTKGKTEISRVSEGVDFLGYRIAPDSISIKETSYNRMFRNLLKVITDFRYRKDVERTLFKLNLKISGCRVDQKRRGWMMFFSQTDDKSQLAYLDRFVSDQLRRVGFPNNRISDVKTFIKSYHEIRFNLIDTSYVPNFDALTVNEQADVIAALTGESIAAVMAQDVQSIELKFRRLVSKEVHALEQDVGNPS